MFGIGLPELILIMAIALIVVGPDKLPDLAKTVAKQLLELKKAAGSLKDSLQEEMNQEAATKPPVVDAESKPEQPAVSQVSAVEATTSIPPPADADLALPTERAETGQQPEPPSAAVGKAG